MEKQNPPPYEEAPPGPGFHSAPPGPGFHSGPPGPPPPSFAAVPPPHQTHISATTVSVAAPMPAPPTVQLGPNSQFITCPSCRMQVNTRVESVANSKTHMFALLCCLICFPCVCVPYCIDSCQAQKHTCPNCGSFVGEYNN